MRYVLQAAGCRYKGYVHVMAAFGQFQIVMHLQGLRLGESHIVAEWPRESPNDLTTTDIAAMLTEGDEFTIQLDSPVSSLPCPVVRAAKKELIQEDDRLKVAFELLESNPDFDLLFESIVETGERA